jgi:hypothetical protein
MDSNLRVVKVVIIFLSQVYCLVGSDHIRCIHIGTVAKQTFTRLEEARSFQFIFEA